MMIYVFVPSYNILRQFTYSILTEKKESPITPDKKDILQKLSIMATASDLVNIDVKLSGL